MPDAGLRLAVELAEECVEETRGLQAASWAETFGALGDARFMPHMPGRFQNERAGRYVFATLRDAGRLVGMCGFTIKFSELTSQPYAVGDVIYLLPEYRRGLNARNLWRFAVAECFRRGVREIRHVWPLSAPTKFLESEGLAPRSVVHGRIYTDEEARHALEETTQNI